MPVNFLEIEHLPCSGLRVPEFQSLVMLLLQNILQGIFFALWNHRRNLPQDI